MDRTIDSNKDFIYFSEFFFFFFLKKFPIALKKSSDIHTEQNYH